MPNLIRYQHDVFLGQLPKDLMHYDIFNGDADGICALLQLRKAFPKPGTLVTGVKRDIQLLQQVVAKQDTTSVTVLDISMEKNLNALSALLSKDIPVFYCDHHRTGNIPQHDQLTHQLSLEPTVCTSLLINQYLNNKQIVWAIVGAFGDNLTEQALTLAINQGYDTSKIEYFQELGTLINYNSYGESVEDLTIAPDILYQELFNYATPFELRSDPGSAYYRLKLAYAKDINHIRQLQPSIKNDTLALYQIPDQPWARRISGTLANQLVRQHPNRAHAILTELADNQGYKVSLRAPLNRRYGADKVCIQFETGGGRPAAAGINRLTEDEVPRLVEAMMAEFKRY